YNKSYTYLIYTLYLHDALPIYTVGIISASSEKTPFNSLHFLLPLSLSISSISFSDMSSSSSSSPPTSLASINVSNLFHPDSSPRSEEHTSELQSRFDLVCRLLL